MKADLARLHIGSVPALLARQVHSDEGQRRFAGEGPVNTDDRNRLEFESPVAYFVGGYVTFDDDRLDAQRRSKLALSSFLNGRAPDCEVAGAICDALAAVHPAQDPVLLRAVADADACVRSTDGH